MPPADDRVIAGEHRHRFGAMGGSAEFCLAGAAPVAAVAAAEQEVRRIEAKYSRYRPDSLLSRINAAAGSGQAIEVDEETAALLAFADRLHVQSEGRFDLSSGVLRQAWDFRVARLPEPARLAELCGLIGWQWIGWRAGSSSIALPVAGMELDFGGIGKEYAADRAAAVLLAAGLRSGYVNLAGDIRVLGPRPDGQGWSLGIQHPRRLDATIAGLELGSGALATSGDYERYIEVDGRRYCHLLDPRSGWPVQHWQSVSVVAPLCIAAGALATIAMLMAEAAPAFLEAQGVAWLAVDSAGELHRGAR